MARRQPPPPPEGGLPVGRFVVGCVFLLTASWAFSRTFGKQATAASATPLAAAVVRTAVPAGPKPAATARRQQAAPSGTSTSQLKPKPGPKPGKKAVAKQHVAKDKPPKAKDKRAAKLPKRTTIVVGPAAWKGPGFGFTVPARWTMQPLPALGKWPKAIRRWELSLPLQGGRAKIDVEADKTEDYARKGALLDTRAVAAATAENFGFKAYQNIELTVKQAPGFYEAWDAQIPGNAPFRVVAAHFLRGGVHYRLGAVAPLGDDAPIAEHALREILGSWHWK